jgi:hypothetical protein
VADFTDREALTAAMRGTAAAFALTTPFESGPGAEVAQGQAIIAAAAALILAGPTPFTGRRIELASDAPTPAQMSQALTGAMNHPVRFREVPVPSHPDMAAMWQFLRGAGYQADIAALRRAYPTVGWTTFTAWAQRTFS